MMRAYRIVAVALLATAAGAAAAACGGEPGASPRERVEAADEATLDAGTAAFSLESRFRADPDTLQGAWSTFTAEGATDFRTGTARFRTRFGPGISLTVLNDGDTLYFRLPTMLAVGDRARWVRQPVSEIGALGPGGTGLTQAPLPFLRALDSVPGEIRELGPDTVRGVPVDGFGFAVRASRLMPAETTVPPEMDSLRIPLTVWLDADGRVRRLGAEMETTSMLSALRGAAGDSLPPRSRRALEVIGRGSTGRVAVTVELFDFGTEVVSRPPDTAEVVDADSLARELGGAGIWDAGVPPGPAGPAAGDDTTAGSGSADG